MNPEQLHAVFVHFIIALFTVAFVADLLFLYTKKQRFEVLARYNLYISAIFAIFAIISGTIAEELVTVPRNAADIFENHESFAFITASCVLTVTLWRIGLQGRFPVKLRWLSLMVASIGFLFLAFTAYYGGELVYKHGVGVKTETTKIEKKDDSPRFKNKIQFIEPQKNDVE